MGFDPLDRRARTILRSYRLIVVASRPVPGRRRGFSGEALPSASTQRREVEGERRDGSRLTLQLTLCELPTRGGILHTAFLYDLTERHRIDRLKDEFVATVSHEVRTPLTSIRGGLGLVVGGVLGEVPAAVKQVLEIANANTQQLTALINDILDVQRLELGSQSLEVVETKLVRVVEESLAVHHGYTR